MLLEVVNTQNMNLLNSYSPFIRHFGEIEKIIFKNVVLLATYSPFWRDRIGNLNVE